MRKFLFSIVIFSVVTFNIFAASGRRLAVFPEFEGQSSDANAWISDFVGERLEANLSKFADFTIVNSTNQDEIVNLQMQSESDKYDESTALAVDKMLYPTHALYATIRESITGYTLSVRITDLETNADIVNILPISRETADDLAGYYGCAVDEITIKICEDLGISLTPTQKHLIMNGEVGLSDSEKSAMYDEDARRYAEQIKNLNQEINLIADDTDGDAEVRQKNLEAERKFAEEKLKWVNAKKERIREEERKRAEDEKLNTARSEAQRERIMSTSLALNEKMEYLRDNQKEKKSLLGQIKAIESTKKLFVDYNNKFAAEKQVIIDEAEDDVEYKFLEIDSRPLRNSEMSNGVITESASKNREIELERYRSKRMAEAEVAIKSIDKTMMDQQEKLISDINHGYKNVQNKTLNTINNELIIDFGDYDGELFGWDIYVTVQSDDIIIFQTKSFIDYETITGRKPVTDFDAKGYDEFNDDIDFYVSMFSRGEPILTFAIDVAVIPSDKDSPSEYTFIFDNLRFYETMDVKFNKNGIYTKPKAKLAMDDSTVIRQMEPAYDIHTKKELDEEARRYQEYVNKLEKENAKLAEKARKELEKEEEENYRQMMLEIEEEERRQEEYEKERLREEKKAAKREAVRNRPADKNYKHSLFGINAGYSFTDTTAPSVGIELATGLFPFFYFDYKANLLNLEPNKSMYYPITDPKLNFVLTNMFQLGINIPAGGIVELFFSGGVGFNWYCPVSVFRDNKNIINQVDSVATKSIFDMTYGLSAGILIEPIRHFGITGAYNMTVISKKKHKYHTIDFGIAFVF